MLAAHLVLDDVDEVDDPVPRLRVRELEHIIQVAAVGGVVRLDLERKSESNFSAMTIYIFHRIEFCDSLFDEGTLEARLGVGVGVPRLLLHGEGRLGQQALEPAGEVAAHMINLWK